MSDKTNMTVGKVIKFGEEYRKKHHQELQYAQLIDGYFDHDNGLYTETQSAPSIYNGDEGEEGFDSIYHLFGNKLEDWMDCELFDSIDEAVNQKLQEAVMSDEEIEKESFNKYPEQLQNVPYDVDVIDQNEYVRSVFELGLSTSNARIKNLINNDKG